MKKMFLSAMLLTSVLCALPVRADAKITVFESLTAAQLKQIMAGEGYNVTVDEDGDISWKLDGYKAFITFYDKNHSMQFFVRFTAENPDPEKVNLFNAKYRFGRTYIATGKKGKALALELDLDFAGGITEARLKDFLKTCQHIFSAWRDKVL